MADESTSQAQQAAEVTPGATGSPKVTKYKVLKEWVNGEETHAEGAEVEVDEETAAPLLEDGTLEPVAAE